MFIEFKSKKLKKQCEDSLISKTKFGEDCSRKIILRLSQIQAMPNLEELGKLPQTGLHRLKGNRKDQFAVYLNHPMRLVFIPIGDDEEIKPEGILLLEKVTKVRILEIVDYH